MEDWVVLYSPATCSKDPLPLKFTQNEYEAGQKGTGWTKFVRVRFNTTSIYSIKNSLSYHWLAWVAWNSYKVDTFKQNTVKLDFKRKFCHNFFSP